MGLENSNEENVGVWGLEPECRPEDSARSARIDAELREDRIAAIRDACSVLVLAEPSPDADKARHRMACSMAAVLGHTSDVPPLGQALSVQGQLADGAGKVQLDSFATSKKNKGSQIKLSAVDPNVVVYVVNVHCVPDKPDDTPAEALLASLKKALAHLLFVGATVGTLDKSAVCITLANCAELRKSLAALEGDAAFHDKLKNYFCAIDSTASDQVLLGIANELEVALESFKVAEVRTIFIEENLASEQLSATSPCDAIAIQVLDIVQGIQEARVREVKEAEMGCKVENVRPRPKEVVETTAISGVYWAVAIGLIALAFFGAFSAVNDAEAPLTNEL